jgi:hypothetical protein
VRTIENEGASGYIDENKDWDKLSHLTWTHHKASFDPPGPFRLDSPRSTLTRAPHPIVCEDSPG